MKVMFAPRRLSQVMSMQHLNHIDKTKRINRQLVINPDHPHLSDPQLLL